MTRSLRIWPAVVGAALVAAVSLPVTPASAQNNPRDRRDESSAERERRDHGEGYGMGRSHDGDRYYKNDHDDDDNDDVFDDDEFGDDDDDDDEEGEHRTVASVPPLLGGIVLDDRERRELIAVRDRHFARISALRDSLANERAPRAEPRSVASCWSDLPLDERRALVGTDREVRRERLAFFQDVRAILTPRQRARFNANARRWSAARDQQLAWRRAHAHC